MSKFSFKNTAAAAAPAPAASAAPAAPAPAPAEALAQTTQAGPLDAKPAVPNVPAPTNTAVAAARERPLYEDDADNLTTEDIRTPRMNIIQNVGDLSTIFTPGEIVLNQSSVIRRSAKDVPDAPPLRVTVLGFRPDRYVERVDGGELGNIFNSLEEVAANGGTANWQEHASTGKPLYQQLAEALILIEKPEGIEDPSFSFYFEDKQYAVALWAMKGSAYTSGAKVFRTARKIGWLADGYDADRNPVKRSYLHGVWELSVVNKKFRTGNWAWVPVLRNGGYNSPEFVEFAQSFLG